MKATVANLSQTPRRLGLFNILALYTYGPGCLARTLCCILFLFAAGAGLRDYWIDKTAFREAKTIKGVVTESDYTAWSFDDQEQLVVSYKFDLNGQPYEGYSYTLNGSWQKNREIDIEYNPANPNYGRIVGFDYCQLPFLVYVPLILALLLAIQAVFGTLKTYRWGRFLENGAVAEAELQDRNSLNSKKDITHLNFQFCDASGTVHEVKTANRIMLRTKGTKTILFDPANPQRYVFLCEAPIMLKLAAKGRWASPDNKRAILGWFCFSIGLLLGAIYLIAKLRT